MTEQNNKPPTGIASGYAMLMPGLIALARDHGYALGLHGSLQRDLDLIAVPWTSGAAAPVELAEAVRGHVGGFWNPHDSNGVGGSKPHGRRCWSIHFGGGQYIDLSVMPRLHDDVEITDGKVFVRLREYSEDAAARSDG